MCSTNADTEINEIWIWNIHIYFGVCKPFIGGTGFFGLFFAHFWANSLYPFVTLTNTDLEWIYINFFPYTEEKKSNLHADYMEISVNATYGFDRLKIKLATPSYPKFWFDFVNSRRTRTMSVKVSETHVEIPADNFKSRKVNFRLW